MVPGEKQHSTAAPGPIVVGTPVFTGQASDSATLEAAVVAPGLPVRQGDEEAPGLVHALQRIQGFATQKYAQHFADSNIRPWSEFLGIEQGDSLKGRVITNLKVYQTNYLVMSGSLTLVGIVANLWSLFTLPMLVLMALWAAYLRFGNSPQWEVIRIGSLEVCRAKQKMILCSITGFVMLMDIGPALLPVLLICILLVAWHAATHRPSQAPESLGQEPEDVDLGCQP
eukprot:TRINITY_DN75698_c0_g1_i1.p1 TRINITY_DN75698_c0_g1~~TRINITY_DN75698_c0_g1_i1.p1  ORF type:complete len:243 (-),score=36.45 TRINITY_DN75698_c0_g1_i1:35-715(-)